MDTTQQPSYVTEEESGILSCDNQISKKNYKNLVRTVVEKLCTTEYKRTAGVTYEDVSDVKQFVFSDFTKVFKARSYDHKIDVNMFAGNINPDTIRVSVMFVPDATNAASMNAVYVLVKNFRVELERFYGSVRFNTENRESTDGVVYINMYTNSKK